MHLCNIFRKGKRIYGRHWGSVQKLLGLSTAFDAVVAESLITDCISRRRAVKFLSKAAKLATRVIFVANLRYV